MNAKLDGVVEKIPQFSQLVKSLKAGDLERLRKEGVERQRAALIDDKWDAYLADSRTQGARYAAMGVAFSDWFEVLRAYRVAIEPIVIDHFKGDVKKVATAIRGGDRFIDIAMAVIGESYIEAKQDTIAKQSLAIRELSTPVLQIREKLLIVPLVGVVDTERARQMTNDLLQAVRARRAKVVVLDVTGVPVVDSKVASHLSQTIRAAGLMGTKIIVSGISPEIAQAMVAVGVELDVETTGDLQAGIELADEVLSEHERRARS